MTKRFWNIKGTDKHSEIKEELKPVRTDLNSKAGIDEKNTPASQWPYKITKGPEHPKVRPFFREVRMGATFKSGGELFKKIDGVSARRVDENGILSVLSRTFPLDLQVDNI